MNRRDFSGWVIIALTALSCWGVAACAKPLVVHRSAASDPYPSGYTAWIADAVATAKHHGARWADSGSVYRVDLDAAINHGQYEPWYGFRRIAAHVGGDAQLETYAEAAEDAWRPYSTNNSGGVQGFYNYTDGFRVDWVQNADTVSRDALIDQAVSANYAQGSSSAIMKASGFSREVAYAILGYINSEVYCGEAHNARMEPMLELILANAGASVDIGGATTLTNGGHIEQWLGSITTDSSGNETGGTHNFNVGETTTVGAVTYDQGFTPSVGGSITAYTLIRHYENSASINGGITPDARIVPKLVRLFDAIWLYYWLPDDNAMSYAFYTHDVEDDPIVPYRSDVPATALNNMTGVVYWWLYKETGDIRHLERGDALFNGTNGYSSLTYRGVDATVSLAKEFNELTRWTIDGLEWRAEGVALHGN